MGVDKGTVPEQTRRFYRQANYYLMNRIWVYIYGRNGKSVKELYEWIGLTSNYFSRILQDEVYSTVKLDQKWNTTMYCMGEGLEDYMKGYALIPLPGITEEDWISYFTTRYTEQKKASIDIQNQRKYEMADFNAKIKEALSSLSGNTNTPADLLYYFCRYGRAKTIERPPYYRVEELEGILAGLTFFQWEQAPGALLDRVLPLLQRQYDTARTIKEYKSLKEKDR